MHWLAAHDPDVMRNYPQYLLQVSAIRSSLIWILRTNRVRGRIRSMYNDSLEHKLDHSYERYLYYKKPLCALCNGPFSGFHEVTKDHIIPVFLGGKNKPSNRQLAHGHCNVLKGHRNITKLNMYNYYN